MRVKKVCKNCEFFAGGGCVYQDFCSEIYQNDLTRGQAKLRSDIYCTGEEDCNCKSCVQFRNSEVSPEIFKDILGFFGFDEGLSFAM